MNVLVLFLFGFLCWFFFFFEELLLLSIFLLLDSIRKNNVLLITSVKHGRQSLARSGWPSVSFLEGLRVGL